jgi:hypothetical protein
MDRLIYHAQLTGWIPVRLDWDKGEPTIDWCYADSRSLGGQSFDQIVDECLSLPFNLLFRHQTPIEVLGRWSEVQPGLRPTGFIFHLSRSGSSLVSRMLAGLQRNIVISEARPIDATLRAHFHCAQIKAAQRILWLRWMMNALAQKRRGDEEHFFIKFHAWNTLELPLIRRAFPDVPWVFLYSDPVEVMVSQFSQRGAHMIAGALPPALFGMDLRAATSLPPEEYCAKVLAMICKAALQHSREGGRLINYRELPEVVPDSLLNFFGLRCSDSELDTVRAAAKRDAKNPVATFQNDSQKKREKATEAIRDAADKLLYPVYEELEAVRQAQPAIP